MIRPLAFTAALVALAAPALAQTAGQTAPTTGQTRALAPSSPPTAAATLPNTFDGPPARAVVATPVSAPVQVEVTDADMAEGALRAVIADLAEGTLDDALFTEELAERLRPQLAALKPVVEGFGPLGEIELQGPNNGASQFLVTFDNAVTQWVIGLSEDGRISALLFRPAPAVSSDPETSGPITPPTEETPPPPPAAAVD